MKKRTACKIITGAVTMCVLVTGHCGTIRLEGERGVTLAVHAVVDGLELRRDATAYSVNVGCAVCEGYYGPCVSAPARDVRVTSRWDVRDVRYTAGTWLSGKKGTMIEWEPSAGHDTSRIGLDITCDNAVNRNWTWVDVEFFRDRRYPTSKIRVTATNLNKGVTEVSDTAWIGSTWAPSWGSVQGTAGSHGTATVRYADELVLRGRNAKALVLYDIEGSSPITARIDELPDGLSCARSSDGVKVAAGTTADVWPGDSIACTNALRGKKSLNGTLTVTAMFR